MDTEQSKEEPLFVVKETKLGDDPQVVEETKKESDNSKDSDVVTAGTFGFQGEVVKSEEKSTVGYCMSVLTVTPPLPRPLLGGDYGWC